MLMRRIENMYTHHDPGMELHRTLHNTIYVKLYLWLFIKFNMTWHKVPTANFLNKVRMFVAVWHEYTLPCLTRPNSVYNRPQAAYAGRKRRQNWTGGQARGLGWLHVIVSRWRGMLFIVSITVIFLVQTRLSYRLHDIVWILRDVYIAGCGYCWM